MRHLIGRAAAGVALAAIAIVPLGGVASAATAKEHKICVHHDGTLLLGGLLGDLLEDLLDGLLDLGDLRC